MRGQRGVVLVIALIVMVAMIMAGIAMVRSVDTSTIIAGNLAFKQSGTSSGDLGVEAAITWLGANGASLIDDNATNAADGYYANSQDCLDLTGGGHVPPATTCPTTSVLDWSDAAKVKAPVLDTTTGNSVQYVIHRMCNLPGALNGGTCAVEQSSQTGSSEGAARQMATYQPGSWSSVSNRGFYRITARVTGPRNTVSFVQAVISQ